MASILDENLVTGTPEEHFAADVLEFSKTYNVEAYRRIYEYASKHFERLKGKLCWKKYHYFAITNSNWVDRWLEGKKVGQLGASPKLIVGSELLEDTTKTWSTRCMVFRAIGNVGPKNRRSAWFKIYRDSFNPVITSGWKFREYDIFMIPRKDIDALVNFLPYSEEES